MAKGAGSNGAGRQVVIDSIAGSDGEGEDGEKDNDDGGNGDEVNNNDGDGRYYIYSKTT